jgi:hypothetical protein
MLDVCRQRLCFAFYGRILGLAIYSGYAWLNPGEAPESDQTIVVGGYMVSRPGVALASLSCGHGAGDGVWFCLAVTSSGRRFRSARWTCTK